MTAAQCREHRWLAGKTHKTRSEKEAAALTAATRLAFIENRPVDTGLADDNGREELDVTKDNLRLFVERWREHPDSPYTIDVCHVLPRDPLRDHSDSVSLRAHSPSPCDSLRSSSTQSERVAEPLVKDSSGHLLSVPSLSLSLERRASEGTAARDRRDPASQIALAEEIIKLSEHLRAIAMGSSRVVENQKVPRGQGTTAIDAERPRTAGEAAAKNRTAYSSSNVTLTVSPRDTDGETNEITEKLSSITRQRRLNGTTFHSSRSFDARHNGTSASNVFVSLRRTSVGGDDEAFGYRRNGRKCSFDRATITEGVVRNFDDDESTTEMPFANLEDKGMDLTPPWRRSRVKRSFGETSRDVPRISNLRDLHKNLNLDEPGSTKDLLLHLLGEWDEVAVKTSCDGAGRKSVSLDWCAADSVARRTMSSLAEYFQSKQRETTTSTVTSSTSPSMYRVKRA